MGSARRRWAGVDDQCFVVIMMAVIHKTHTTEQVRHREAVARAHVVLDRINSIIRSW
jgi:hypothetical protein